MPKEPKNFYVTTENKEFLRRNFLNLRFFALISVPDIISSLGENHTTMSDYNQFIVNKTIVKELEDVIKRKRFYSIIYSNPWIDYESIKNLQEYLEDNESIKNVILLDDKHNPKHEDYWQYFQEVKFFPSARKVRIVECEEFKTPMFYWVNNMEIPKELQEKYPEAVRTFSEDENV